MPPVDGKVLNRIHEPGDLPLFHRINSLRKLGELTANRWTGILFIMLLFCLPWMLPFLREASFLLELIAKTFTTIKLGGFQNGYF